jgi:hypothetical protein
VRDFGVIDIRNVVMSHDTPTGLGCISCREQVAMFPRLTTSARHDNAVSTKTCRFRPNKSALRKLHNNPTPEWELAIV